MKAAWLALWILTVAASFVLARLTAPPGEITDLGSLDSFRAALISSSTNNTRKALTKELASPVTGCDNIDVPLF